MEPTIQQGTFYRAGYVFHGVWGALFAIVVLALVLVPFGRIWMRTGHSSLWALLMLVPVANLVSLWVLAFKKWPAVDR